MKKEENQNPSDVLTNELAHAGRMLGNSLACRQDYWN